jgi:hypothetical protein
MFKIKDKSFVPKSTDQAAVPEGRRELRRIHLSVSKSGLIVG